VKIGIKEGNCFALFLSLLIGWPIYPIDDQVVTFRTTHAATQGDKTKIRKQ